jgi:alanine racemase
LLLGYIRPENLEQAINKDISLTVYSNEIIRKIISLRLNKKAKIHLKVETGLNRQGLKRDEVLRLSSLIKSNKEQFILEGLSTHFANIEDTLDPSFALSQLENFRKTIQVLKRKLDNTPLCHCAASAAALLYPETHFGMVRIGIGLYGLWPSKETQIAFRLRRRKPMSLKPVLSWKSTVAQVKELGTGESVGYGRTWFAPKRSKIAIIATGYFDGYDRKLSNQGRVLIRGKFAPVIGRVAMNMIMVDVSEIPGVKTNDPVILIGKSRNKFISAEELAEKVRTINYEVVSRINPLLPRVVV